MLATGVLVILMFTLVLAGCGGDGFYQYTDGVCKDGHAFSVQIKTEKYTPGSDIANEQCRNHGGVENFH